MVKLVNSQLHQDTLTLEILPKWKEVHRQKKPGPFLNGGHCVAKASLLMVLMVFGGGFFLFGEFMNGNRRFLSRMMVI